MAAKLPPVWHCPKCGARLVTRNMWHSCGRFSLEALFARSEPRVMDLFRRFERMVRACGPVVMIPQKTRIVFVARVRFAGCHVRRRYLLCGLALPRRTPHPRFVKIESFNEHWHGHWFRIESAEQLDGVVQRWLRESYRIGVQERLAKVGAAKARPAKARPPKARPVSRLRALIRTDMQ